MSTHAQQDDTTESVTPPPSDPPRRGFDLGSAPSVAEREDEGAVVHVRSETGERLYDGDVPVTITVAGTYSTRYKAATLAQRNRALKTRQADFDAERLDENALAIMSACVISWQGFRAGDVPLAPTPQNVRAVFERAPWIREQVEAAMTDHAAFFR